jgi:uncharacterized protein with HEPN domain
MKESKPYLVNIIGSIEAIEDYRPASEHELMGDNKTQDAILMRLQDIGENLLHIRDQFPSFWEEHAANSWSKSIGLRNIISHGYGEVKLSIIWHLITEDLESFKHSVQKLL